MKFALHKSISMAMALLVLVSTMSFTVEKHFCGKHLVDHAVFSSVKKCKSDMCSAGGMSHMGMRKEGCCTNTKKEIEGQDELTRVYTSFDLTPQVFIIPLATLFADLIEEMPREMIPYRYYEPPQLVFDIQVLDQVFTI